jgi:Restriction endonuclease/WG containing repeat
MSVDLISDHEFLKIASVITDPKKSYYSSFPEFTPLEFEHFCIKLLNINGYIILSSNSNIASDGGIDFVASKDNRIIIGQCKKSDWSGKIVGGNASNIGEPTVMQHFGLVNIKSTEYPDKEVIGYVMTLSKFSLPCKNTFGANPKIKLIGLSELRDLINIAISAIETALRSDYDTNQWYDDQVIAINTEISILENLVANIELELSQASTRSNQVEKIIMNELIDLYREIALIKSEIEFMKAKKAKLTEEKNKQDEELTEEYQNKQQKINEEYDGLEEEYINPTIEPLSDTDLEEAKTLYRELSHLYHPDKHQESKTEFTRIFQAINSSKSSLSSLIDIRDNPHKYFDGKIPESINITKEQLIEYLNKLQEQYANIQTKLETILEGTNNQLYKTYYNDRNEFDAVVATKKSNLQLELDRLRKELQEIVDEISQYLISQLTQSNYMVQSIASTKDNSIKQAILDEVTNKIDWKVLEKFEDQATNTWGYKNTITKEITIEPVFDKCESFSEGIARVMFKGKWRFIKVDKSYLVEPRFDDCHPFSEGIACVKLNRKWGYITTDGKYLFEPMFDVCESFSEGLAVVGLYTEDGLKYGFVKVDGSWLARPKFDESNSFHNGFANVELDGEAGFIDKDGRWFSEGFARVWLDGKCGFIETDGSYLVEPRFDGCFDFSEGIACVKLNCKWGYITTDGKYLLEPIFDECRSFSEGFARVILDGKCGFIETDGSYLVEPEFDDCYDFENDFARVMLDDYWGYIKTDGNYLIEPKFGYCYDFDEGFAEVELDGKNGKIDIEGREYWD